MFKPTNFSDRHEASLKTFQVAKDNLVQLRQDIHAEITATEAHLGKLQARRAEVEKSVDALVAVLGK